MSPEPDNRVIIRPMQESDLILLHQWLQRPHVLEWWGQEKLDTIELVRTKYLPRLLLQTPVTPYIAMLENRPVGYCQCYRVMGDDFWPEEIDPGARGCDQFLGEETLLGQGIGTKMVTALLAHIYCDKAVTKIQTDPAPHNLRAIRCYEKAGFRRLKTVETPDGPALYMLHERASVNL